MTKLLFVMKVLLDLSSLSVLVLEIDTNNTKMVDSGGSESSPTTTMYL